MIITTPDPRKSGWIAALTGLAVGSLVLVGRSTRSSTALGIALPRYGWGHYWKMRFRGREKEYRKFLACELTPARKAKKILGLQKLPEAPRKFGEWMLRMSEKELTPADVVKAQVITAASIRRSPIKTATLEKTWPDHPFPPGIKVRPEDAMATLLMTPEGKSFVETASQGKYNPQAAETIVSKFQIFGHPKPLMRTLQQSPKLAKKAKEAITLVRRASRRQWMEFVAKNATGVNYAKAGFMAALLGRGDMATADGRQQGFWAPELATEKQVGPEFVEALNRRFSQMRVEVPKELQPFYEHLVHHAIWDALEGDKTYHAEIQACMIQ